MKSRHPSFVSNRPRGFTIVEVMVAATVLLFGVVSAITVSQRGLQALDTARNLTAASQLMQSEMERLRMMSWAQLQTLQQSADKKVIPETANADRFTCTRALTVVKADMIEISLAAVWKGYDGREHTARLITRYGKNGLNDYFYVAH